MKTMLTTAAALAATLCATAAAEPDRVVLPTPADALQEIAYEFRFAYDPSEVGTDALRDRLRAEAGDYCDDATREADLGDYAGQCTRVVVGAVDERLDDLSALPRLASYD